jgi:hypothetical protein
MQLLTKTTQGFDIIVITILIKMGFVDLSFDI